MAEELYLKNIELNTFHDRRMHRSRSRHPSREGEPRSYYEAVLTAERTDGTFFAVVIRVPYRDDADRQIPVTIKDVGIRFSRALARMEEYRTCACVLGKPCDLHARIDNPFV